MTKILELDDVHSFYDKSHILQGVSFEINSGETVCLLGRNGAGKTTVIRSIIGLKPPIVKSGNIMLSGESTINIAPFLNARKGIAYVPQGRRIFPRLTVIDNLKIVRKNKKVSIEQVFEFFPMLKKVKNSRGEELSGGELQALAIGRALVNESKLLLLDEPSEGLAPIIIQSMAELINELKGSMAILLAEQNVKFALRASDRGYVIDKGTIVYEGTSHEISENEQIKKDFLAV
jgi:branched-chain amino acid transport system ATP-binding protein